MKRTVIRWAAAMGALLGAGIGIGAMTGPARPASAAPSAPYPVVWSFLPTATVAAAENGPDVAPPGSNIPCTPSATHPDPVILVHGLGADQNDNWQALSPFLADNGYCVYSLTYGNMTADPRPFDEMGALTDMATSAAQLAGFVNQVRAETHAPKVDIVGHSEGGTVPDYYLKFLGGSTQVAHFVTLSGVLHGTELGGLAELYDLGAAYGFSPAETAIAGPLCTACVQMFTGSSFMQSLDAPNAQPSPAEAATCPYDGAAVDGVDYTSIATRYDELVQPYTSDFIDPRCGGPAYGIGVDDIVVQHQCAIDLADHIDISADPVAAQDVLDALDPAHAQPVRCTLTLPAVG
jgi:pimeloyl-ACP methyl ester carboxylesterase